MVGLLLKDGAANAPDAPESPRPIKVFLQVAKGLERLGDDIAFGRDGPLAAAEDWSEKLELTQGQLLERLDGLPG